MCTVFRSLARAFVLLFTIAGLVVLTPALAHARTGDGAPAAVAELTALNGSMLFGAFLNPDDVARYTGKPLGSLTSQGVMDEFEKTTGRKFDLHRIYLYWDSAMPTTAADSLARQRTPIISFSGYRKDGSKISYAAVTKGAYDSQISAHAKAIAALKSPVFVSFQHEPDVATGFGTPAEYVAAWRYIVAKFRGLGVTNASWVWIMTPMSFRTPPIGAGAAAYYPGNDVVQWMGLDGYNWYGCQSDKPKEWRSMTTIAGGFRSFGISKGKPLMLPEWGSVEDPAVPGRKAAWLRESAATLASWPEVKAASYFNTHGNCAWWLDSSASSLTAWKELAASAQAHGRANATLTPSTSFGVAPLAVSFKGSASAGARYRSGSGVASWRLDYGDGTSASGTGTPPSGISHSYRAGTFTARLTLTDSAGLTAADARLIKAVGAPIVTGSESSVTSGSANLNTWSNTQGLTGSLVYEWGTTTAYGSKSSTFQLSALGYAVKRYLPVKGLKPGTKYYWRATVRTSGGTTVLSRYFRTAA